MLTLSSGVEKTLAIVVVEWTCHPKYSHSLASLPKSVCYRSPLEGMMMDLAPQCLKEVETPGYRICFT